MNVPERRTSYYDRKLFFRVPENQNIFLILNRNPTGFLLILMTAESIFTFI
jgi:hypothetical protein